jgi:glycolate oxidase
MRPRCSSSRSTGPPPPSRRSRGRSKRRPFQHGVGTIRVATDEAERALLWKGRKSAFGAIARIAPHYHLHDCVVPRTKLAEILVGRLRDREPPRASSSRTCSTPATATSIPLFSFDRSVPGTLDRVLAASDELVRLCVDAGGALSGEHGIGLEKRDFMPLVFTPDDLDAQACLRAAFDPDGRMNPQKGPARRRPVRRLAAAALAREGALPEGTWI